MLSDRECNSISEAIKSLNQALNSLLSCHRAGIDVQDCIVAVTQVLESLEDLVPEEPVESKETASEAMQLLNDRREFDG
jgi:hypothetical protein